MWRVMQRNVWADNANLRIKRLNNSTKYHSMHWWPSCQGRRIEIRRRIVKSMLSKFSEMLKYMARIGRPNILWSVNKLARAVTKWTKACDTSLASLISYIHHTSEYWQYCYVGNTAQQCRLGLFLDSNFAGDPEDSKSTSGGLLCIFGSHTFVPRNWICKKQTSVSHSSTKAEIISLDAGVRMDGIPALTLWDLMIERFHSLPNKNRRTQESYWETRQQSSSQTCITPSQ